MLRLMCGVHFFYVAAYLTVCNTFSPEQSKANKSNAQIQACNEPMPERRPPAPKIVFFPLENTTENYQTPFFFFLVHFFPQDPTFL